MQLKKESALVIGGYGLVGSYMTRALKKHGYLPVRASRNSKEFPIDISQANGTSVEQALQSIRPSLVVNCAAIVDISACEKNPRIARSVNTDGARNVADACEAQGCTLIHISTDHYYTSGGDRLHNETDSIDLVNEYSKSKREGEIAVLETTEALVVRTNTTGFRYTPGSMTFIEWLLENITQDKEASLFRDYFTSTIDCHSLAHACLELVQRGGRGIFNVGSRSCCSKYEFARIFATALGVDSMNMSPGSVNSLGTRRAASLGLDCGKVEDFLGRKMPTHQEVATALAKEATRRGLV